MSFCSMSLKKPKLPTMIHAPHRSTGINVLEDLLKKIIPQIEDDYKLLTTSEEQRESYRAHIVQAVVQTLTPVELNNDAPDDSPTKGLDEEIDIDISDGDEDERFIDIRSDKEKAAEEEKKKRIHGILSVSKEKIPRVATWRIQLLKKLNLKSLILTTCSPIPKIKKFSLTT